MRKFDIDYVDPDPTIGDWGWAQRPYVEEIERQYNAGKPVRLIILKARQLGISTATEACLFLWAFFHRGTNGLVVSYEDGQAQELFQMTKLYWDTWPHRGLYTLQYSTKRQLRWLETKSQIRVATAKNSQGLRGSTIHALHASEVAFWPDPESFWVGMKQTIPDRHGSIVVLESTANGVGNWFYEMWQSAEEGESEFTPLFFPWFTHPAYKMHTTLNVRSELTSDEGELLDRMRANNMSDDHAFASLAWRRWAIINKANGDIQFFMQEYPSYPEEAFITSGKPIFSPLSLKDCFDERGGIAGNLFRDTNGRVRFIPDVAGSLTLYKRPHHKDTRTDRYFVAGDPSETVSGDPGCIQVINRASLEQVAVWHGRSNPIHFAKEMMLLGDFYNHAMLCPEVEGGGQACIGAILQSGYDNVWLDKRPDRIRGSFNVFGWSTNFQRKGWAIGALQRVIIDKSITIHDRKTYNQLRNYVEHENGYWGNSDPKTHDDAVMALAIAIAASDREGPFIPDQGYNNIYVDIFNQQAEELSMTDPYEAVSQWR